MVALKQRNVEEAKRLVLEEIANPLHPSYGACGTHPVMLLLLCFCCFVLVVLVILICLLLFVSYYLLLCYCYSYW